MFNVIIQLNATPILLSIMKSFHVPICRIWTCMECNDGMDMLYSCVFVYLQELLKLPRHLATCM